MEDKKVPLSLRVSPQLKAELHQFAKREKRPIGNLAELLLEWAFERLTEAGSTMNLLAASPEDLATPRGRIRKELADVLSKKK